jgi:L-alanine-DL-glutamate epimerase-like enolase superfamily enzyme
MGTPRITDIKVMTLRRPDIPPWNLIRVDTDQGVSGLGEAYWGWGLRPVIDNYLKPLLVGQDPLDVDRLYTKMGHQWAGGNALSGLVVTAMSGIEIALWDLAGKITGLPVYRLLGGKFRDRIRLYRTGMPADILSRDSVNEWASQVKAEGWTAIKTVDVESLGARYDPEYAEVGHERMSRRLTSADMRRTECAMQNLRLAFGDDFDIALHCHWALDLPDALSLAHRMAPYRPAWLEDPLPPQFSSAWVELARASEIPILTGENLYTRHEFRPFIEQGGLHMIQIDIPKAGGLLESKRIADLADLRYIPTYAHNASSIVGIVASAHAALTMRDFGLMERAGYQWPWFEELVECDRPIVADGYITVPEGPGLALKLNRALVESLLAPGEGWWGE